MCRYKTNDEFRNKLQTVNKYAYYELEQLEEYNGVYKKIKFRDKYGVLLCTPKNLLDGKIPTILVAENKTKYWINKAIERRGDALFGYDRVNYIRASKKVEIYCKIHNEYFSISPNNFLSGKSCIKCRFDEASRRYTTPYEEYVEILKSRKFDISRIVGEYTGMKCKILIRDEYGIVETYAHRVGVNKTTIETAVDKDSYLINMFKKLRVDKGLFYDYSKVEYVNAKTKIRIICPKHGEFLQTPSNHFYNGCPNCKSSNFEIKVRTFLIESDIPHILEHKFDDCVYKDKLRFDFYLPKLNTIIETDGIQHFEPINFGGMADEEVKHGFNEIKARDEIKNKYCKDNNIKLIRIPYWDFENVEEILIKELNISNKTTNKASTTI